MDKLFAILLAGLMLSTLLMLIGKLIGAITFSWVLVFSPLILTFVIAIIAYYVLFTSFNGNSN